MMSIWLVEKYNKVCPIETIYRNIRALMRAEDDKSTTAQSVPSPAILDTRNALPNQAVGNAVTRYGTASRIVRASSEVRHFVFDSPPTTCSLFLSSTRNDVMQSQFVSQ